MDTGNSLRARTSGDCFGLHPFIEAHPEAVFITRTHVSARTDAEAKKWEGAKLAKELFTLRDTRGIPPSHRMAIKPNQGITDFDFVEGMIEGMKEVGCSEDRMYVREGNWLGDEYDRRREVIRPYERIEQRTGVHFTDFPSGRRMPQLTFDTLEEGSEVTWVDCPDGVLFRRIGYVAPFNQPDAWLLSIAKFHPHGMGLTLCCKNLQGLCIRPHIHFCEGMDRIREYPDPILRDFQPDFEKRVEDWYAQHLEAGVPRWDRPDGPRSRGGFWMETWAQRTCDNLSVTNVGLCVIEGIYARSSPREEVMANVILFGRDPFRVDIIGHWLGGHEPGNIGLFHCAWDRGLSDVLNPVDIPVYHWEDGTPVGTSLREIERIPLLTTYLQRDYGGQNEPEWHLVDEPFDYGCFSRDLPWQSDGSEADLAPAEN